MKNSVAVFIFSVLDQKSSFRANLVQNVKIVSLRVSLVASLIRISRMMRFTFFTFDWKYPFWANLFQKLKIVSLS